LKNPFKKYRIDYLLSGSFAGLFVILLMLVSWFSYSLSSTELAENTFYYRQGLLKELNKQVNIQLRSIEQISLALSRNTSLLDYLALEGDYYEKNKAQTQLSIDYLNPVVNSTQSIQAIQLFVKSPAFSDHKSIVSYVEHDDMYTQFWYPIVEKADFAWIGEHFVETPSGRQPVITFARKIYSSGTLEYQGLLLIHMKALELYNILNEEKQGPERYLLDSGERLLIGNQQSYNSLLPTSFIDDRKASTEYVHYKGSMGDYLVVWARAFNEGSMLIELTPWQEVTAKSFKLAATLLSFGLGAVLVALLITYFLSQNFMKPISTLLQAMGRFPLKPLELPEDYENEFGVMFNGYHRLTERIEELYNTLENQYKRQREAELKALQAMINPHFLYNTLDQLNWMAIEEGHEKMSQTLVLMGTMFRVGLSDGESFIRIEQELIHTECYLKIQQLCWGSGLTYEISVQESSKMLYIPKLTIQPFVENAIIHGFHGRHTGHICIAVSEDELGICLKIEDNGMGLKPDWNKTPRRQTGGYGTRNVRERIDAYFGKPFGLHIENRDTEGTAATIRIPKLEHNEEANNRVEHRNY
jgi:two-component system sensor histidine kinase YesM